MPARPKYFHIAAIGILCALSVGSAPAQDAPAPPSDAQMLAPSDMPPMPPPGVATVDILPAHSLSTNDIPIFDPDNPTHPVLRLTPDKSEIVRLDQDAGTVIVGNPLHISVMAENTRTLVVVPKNPGATYFTVLSSRGEVIMQRHVIVASPKEKYVRIRKSCADAGKGECQPTQVYYCPDMCHEIILNTEVKEESKSSAEIKAGGDKGGQTIGGGADSGANDTSGSDAGDSGDASAGQ